jgi:soluble lytic murein transglycosylase-like protein
MTPVSLSHDVAGARGWLGRNARTVLIALCYALAHAHAFGAAAIAQGSRIAALREEAANYEHGEGVAQNGPLAVALYCDAARLGDAESQFNLGWIYANGRGVPRSDALAAFFFAAAAAQGVEQARRMLQVVGGQSGEVPECMREPAPEASPPSDVGPARPFAIRTSAPKALVDLVKTMAPHYGVEPQLVLAIMEAESHFDSTALSPKNAQGLMQLVPDTAARFKVQDSFDPKQNIRGGLAYLQWLLAYFEGDLTLVAAAYNAGEGTVERYRGVPPYGETRRYVRRIVEATGSAVHPFDPRITRPSPQLHMFRESRMQSMAPRDSADNSDRAAE